MYKLWRALISGIDVESPDVLREVRGFIKLGGPFLDLFGGNVPLCAALLIYFRSYPFSKLDIIEVAEHAGIAPSSLQTSIERVLDMIDMEYSAAGFDFSAFKKKIKKIL